MDTNNPDPATLSAIYGAAISIDGWEEAIDRCVDHVGARSAALLRFDRLERSHYQVNTMGRVIREGATPELMQHWLQNLAPLERPAHYYMTGQVAGHIVVDTEAIGLPAVRMQEGEDFRFMRRHFNIGRKFLARLNDSPRFFDNLAFHFPSSLPEIPDSAWAPFAGLLPHVAKAVELGQVFSELQRRYAAVFAVLDRVGVGLVVLDPRGHIIVANTEADRMFELRHGLERRDGRVRCVDAQVSGALQAAIEAASLAGRSGVPCPESLFAVRAVATAEPLLLEVSPLRDHYRELDSVDGTVLLQMVDTGSAEHCSVEPFAVACGLSAAEADVAAHVLAGLTNPEIAEQRGVSIDTVKSQVARIMDKGRADSRVALVRAILKAEPPIGPA